MNWIKLGQVFTVNNTNTYLLSHASNPLPLHLQGDTFRVFYSGRDAQNRSSVSFVDIDIKKVQVVYDHKEPIFTYQPGTFYSHGVSIGNIYMSNGNKYILFMGWQNHEGQHWRGDIGRLMVIDNNQLVVNPAEPFMTIDNEDKISLSYPWVMYNDGIYKMWYGSTLAWETKNAEMLHIIKYATSVDGISWKKKGAAIPYELGIAQAFSKPSVIFDKDGYHMWFSYRDGAGTKYRIGYAFSADGINWQNKLDEVGITVSENGWDDDMLCYPFVFDHNGERYMLYNGNNYGKTGFGIALLEK